MLQQALQKIQEEITTNPEKKLGKHIAKIGKFLIDYVRENPSDAEKLLAEGKTISGAFNAIKTEAMKPENEGVLDDEDGYAVALKYFGVHVPEAAPPPVPVASLDISLDDLGL